jgi:hypothetical protein
MASWHSDSPVRRRSQHPHVSKVFGVQYLSPRSGGGYRWCLFCRGIEAAAYAEAVRREGGFANVITLR